MGIVDLIKKISSPKKNVSGASYEDEDSDEGGGSSPPASSTTTTAKAPQHDEDQKFSIPASPASMNLDSTIPAHNSPKVAFRVDNMPPSSTTSPSSASNTTNTMPNFHSTTKPVRRHSVVANVMPSQGSSQGRVADDIVTQATDDSSVNKQATGRSIAHSRTTTFRSKAQRGRFGVTNNNGLEAAETSVEEDHPALVAPRCKPNDIILVYRDLSDLVSTGVCHNSSRFSSL